MSGANTLHYKNCKTCKKPFVIGRDVELLENYCADCETKGWFSDMKKAGCSVADPEKLGRKPQLVLKKKADLPTVTVNGVKYVDSTSLLFESSKHKKVYPSNKEKENLKAYGQREKARREREDQRIAEIKKVVAQNLGERETIKRLRDLKHYHEHIRIALNLTGVKYWKIVGELGVEGEIAVTARNAYTREEEIGILKMVEQGKSYKEIGEKYGRNSKAIQEKIGRLRKSGHAGT